MKVHSKYLVMFLLVVLSVTLIGCGIPQEDYDALQAQLDQAKKDSTVALNSLQKDIDAAKAQLSSAQKDYDATKSQLESEITSLQSTIDSQTDTLEQKQAEITQLEDRLDTILDTELTQYYEVTYSPNRYIWDLPVTLRSYFDYKNQTRSGELAAMVTLDDTTVADLADLINDSSLRDNLKKSDVINLIAKFTQTLPRTNQEINTANDGYPRYPLETLVEQGGDSEDSSILAATLLSLLDFDVVFISFEAQKHVAIGVYMPNTAGYSFEYKGKRYHYLETTGANWKLGELPTQFIGITPVIYPID